MIVGLLVLLELILVACLLWFLVRRRKPGEPRDLGFFQFTEQRVEVRKAIGGAGIDRQG